MLGINQSDVSNLVRGKRLSHYSLEKLLSFLAMLGYQVTITIDPAEPSDPAQPDDKKPLARVAYTLEPTPASHQWRDVSHT
jgi:DNA primase large subunit